jgi:Glyoxalase-like domain
MNDSLDHIVWICDDLDRGTRRFEDLTGATPRFGGVHASGLTQNALVGLGGRRYFEILAPAKAAGSDDDTWTQLARAACEPRVLTYCLRSPQPLADLARAAVARGWTNAHVQSNGRSRPDGVRLRWQWLAPVVEPFGPAFPFFIDWLDSPHPSGATPAQEPDGGVSLRRFSVGHPRAAALAQVLADCGVHVDTYEAASTSFRVQLDTPRGIVEL